MNEYSFTRCRIPPTPGAGPPAAPSRRGGVAGLALASPAVDTLSSAPAAGLRHALVDVAARVEAVLAGGR